MAVLVVGALSVLVLSAAGCHKVNAENYPCSTSRACPPGYQCGTDLLCHSPARLKLMMDGGCEGGACSDGGPHDMAPVDRPADGEAGRPPDGPPADGPRDVSGDGSGDQSRGRGEACTQDGDCALNHCVDGVCCDSECKGTCESCIEPNRKGYCDPVTGDPRGVTRTPCTGAGTDCGGTCDGTSREVCAYPDETKICAQPSCTSGQASPARTCDLAGHCRPATTVPCASGACTGTTACSNGCDTAAGACPNGQYCDSAGACENKIANGAACSNDAYCLSGSCVDGHCCTQSTCGICQVCTGAGGTCVAVKSADDPDSCTSTSTCDATGACKAKPGSTCRTGNDCSTGNCVDSHCCTQASCGMCQACTSGGGTCVVVAGADDADSCSGAKTCDNTGMCKLTQGQICSVDADCLSTHCVDGVCCDGACLGQCESCGEGTNKGRCIAVSGAPRTGRTACAGDGSACNGSCDGNNRTACTVFADATMFCGSASCQAGVATPAPVCDGAGHCKSGTGSPCGSNLCSGGRCANGCDPTTAPCSSTQFCNSAGACQAKNANGVLCSTDVECSSAHCVDGHCCGAAACGSCQTCTGSNGSCVAVINADDLDTCAGGKTCNATGDCKIKSGNSCTAGADCATGNCVDSRCCGAASCGTCMACTGGGGTCVAVTGADDDTCTGAKTCDSAGNCKVKQGQKCSVAEDCITNHCTDTVCCESDCTGQCEACAESSAPGKCQAVGGAPRSPRLPCTGATTTCGGSCDGTTRATCTFPNTNVQCGQASCTSGIATPLGSCNHMGACTPGMSATCPSGVCAAGMPICANACDLTTNICPASQFCNSSGACQTKIGAAGSCSNDGMCTTGHCVDSHCCGQASCGICQTCTGANGTCASVISADDADTCTNSKTCDANGVCKLKLGQVCSINGDCASASCVDLRCCNGTCGKCQACTGGGGSCVSVMSMDDTDSCTNTMTCDAGGTCKNKPGQSCISPSDCVTGNCVDSRCCTAGSCPVCQACTGANGACAASNEGGTCGAGQSCQSGSCKPNPGCSTAPTSINCPCTTQGLYACNGQQLVFCDFVSGQSGFAWRLFMTCSGTQVCNATAGSCPTALPGAPTNIAVTALAGGRVSLTWSAPTSGPAATSYNISSNPGGVSLSTMSASATISSGLTLGTSYSFTVQSVNAAGPGGSATSATVVVGDVPSAPTSLQVVKNGRRAIVTWAAPATNNGYAVTGYTVTSSPAGFSTTTNVSTTQATFYEVPTGTSYTFSVTATNTFGMGPAASTVAGTFTCTPNVIRTVVGLSVNDSITVQYGTAAVGDLSTTGILDALFNSGAGVDYTGWARFSLASVPAWAVVTSVSFNIVPQGSSGPASLIVHYSTNDNWSRAQNPKAADIARTTVVSNGPVAPGAANIQQKFSLNLNAHNFDLDVEEAGQLLTLGVTNIAGGEAVYNGADSSNRYPSVDITTCE